MPPRLCRWAVTVSGMAISFRRGWWPRALMLRFTIFAQCSWGMAKQRERARSRRAKSRRACLPPCQATLALGGESAALELPAMTRPVDLWRDDLRLVSEVPRPTPCRNDFQQLPQRLLGEGQEVPVALFGLERHGERPFDGYGIRVAHDRPDARNRKRKFRDGHTTLQHSDATGFM